MDADADDESVDDGSCSSDDIRMTESHGVERA